MKLRDRVPVQTLLYSAFFVLFSLSVLPSPVQAGCGCDKPPPVPAAVIPHVAFAGLPITLFHASLTEGQDWTVTFESFGKGPRRQRKKTVQATVVTKRTVTDPSGTTLVPQLVIPLPDVLVGPTRISATTGSDDITILEDEFTVIAQPVSLTEATGHQKILRYQTGVGMDNTLYISVTGLDQVCQAIQFEGFLRRYPLRIDEVVILNAQGFFIDAFGPEGPTYFSLTPPPTKKRGGKSDFLYYFRHSFEEYCTAHQAGGEKEVDPNDHDWHRDGSPHVDYSTLIFAIDGHFKNDKLPKPGRASFALEVTTEVLPAPQTWP